MELLAENINFMRSIIPHMGPEPQERAVWNRQDLPITEPNVRWNAKRKLVYCRYRKSQGTWTQFTKSVPGCEAEHLWMALFRDKCAEVQKFFDEHHCPDAEDSS